MKRNILSLLSRILLLFSLIVVSYALAFSQGKNNSTKSARKIHLSVKENSAFKLPFYKAQVDSAIKIAEAVFNSDTFQNKILKLSFRQDSYCLQRTSCKKNEVDNGIRISGQEVLNDLFKESNVQLLLDVQNKGNALGSTCPWEYSITMYYDNIMKDMEDDSIPPSYKLAVNLCHEYMHQIGYCHIYNGLKEKGGLPDKRYMNQDVTYTIGWETFYILKDWYAKGRKIENL